MREAKFSLHLGKLDGGLGSRAVRVIGESTRFHVGDDVVIGTLGLVTDPAWCGQRHFGSYGLHS